MEKIEISIIIPVYNSEKFIKKCIETVLNQTFKEIEIIVINDGSLDKSLKIIREIEDKRVVLINKKNEGVSEARNVGLEKARGNYILMIDSDDYIEENYLQDSFEEITKNNLDILITDINLIRENQKEYLKDLNLNNEKILNGVEYLKIFVTDNFFGFNCNKFIKKELFIKNEIRYNKNITMMEDVLVLIQIILKSKKVGKLNKAYYNYVQHSNNTTAKITKKHLESIELLEQEVEKILSGDILEKIKIRLFLIKFEYIIALNEIEKNKLIEFIKKNKLNNLSKLNKIYYSKKTKLLICLYLLTPYKLKIKLIKILRFFYKKVKK